MSNPLIDQGTLNRLLASVSWQNFSGLNVTAPFLGPEAIRLALDGDSTEMLPQLTGMVPSPKPYIPATVTINLIKTQPLSAAYKAQMELSTLLGPCVVRPDVTAGVGITPYDFLNCAIESVREQEYSGGNAGWTVVIRGTYQINSSLYP